MPKPKYLEEENITEEYKEIISSLPIEQGWLAKYAYQYQGFWHSKKQLVSVLKCQANFRARDSDVLVVTSPKSGTTWLKALTFALLNRLNHSPDQAHHPLLHNNPHELVPFLEQQLYPYNNDNQVLPDLSGLPNPRLFATHMPWPPLRQLVERVACKLVYICRDPKDTFTSLFHFTNKLRMEDMGGALAQLEEMLDKFCRGMSPSGPYWEHVLGYWRESLENPERVLFLKFEELKADPKSQVRRLALFLGCPFSKEEEESGLDDRILGLCSFESLRSTVVNMNGNLANDIPCNLFFRRGEVGDWKNHLTPEMAQKIDRITDEKFHDAGLKI